MTNETLDFTQPTAVEPTSNVADDKPTPGSVDRDASTECIPSLPVEVEDDEEALEQYMNSMLERLTGGKKSAAAVETEPDPLEPIDAIVEEAQVIAESPREPVRPSELKEDLNGMRELANRNVESALGVHAYSRLVQSTRTTLSAALGVSLTSTLFVLLSHNSGLSWTYPVAIAGTAVAVIVSLRYFGLSRRLAKIDRELKLGTE